MKELDNLTSVVQVAINEALEPTRAIRTQLEKGLKQQQDIREQFTQKYSELVTKLSRGENVETQLNKKAHDYAAADRLIGDYTNAIRINTRDLDRYSPVKVQVKTVLTGANNCIELKHEHSVEAELQAEMHALGMKAKNLLELMDTPEISKALSDLLKAVINFEIVTRNSIKDFNVKEYIP